MKIELGDRGRPNVMEESFAGMTHPNQPLISMCRPKGSEDFDAVFEFELKGVNKAQNDCDAKDNRNMSSENSTMDTCKKLLAAGLAADQELRFIYSLNSTHRPNNRFGLRIRGITHGRPQDNVVDRALLLWQNIRISLSAVQSEYLFMPVVEKEALKEQETKWEWISAVRPEGITIKAKNMTSTGFMKGSNHLMNNPVLVIANELEADQSYSVDSVAIGVGDCIGEINVELSIKHHFLTEQEVQQMRNILEQLYRGAVKQIYKEVELNQGIEDEDLSRRLANKLNLWIKNPIGTRLRCRVLSRKPVPLTYLKLLGSQIFHAPISVDVMKCEHNSTASISNTEAAGNVIDLVDCINGASELPHCIPKASALLDCGVQRTFSYPMNNMSNDGIVLGYAGEGMIVKDIKFSSPDRSRHALIIGATGTGKSTLLYQMVRQDIENGEGTCLIDPHGDLYEQVLESIPQSRVSDVILINPCDFDYAVGINFLECGGEYKHVQMNYITNEMIKIFDRLYDMKLTMGPIFEQYFRNACLLLMDNDLQGMMTLMDVPLLFEDADYRTYLKKCCKNPNVVSFWSRQAESAGGEAALANIAPYITSKLNQFTANAILRPIIGQNRSTIDFRKAMDTGKIVLINLSSGLIGELDSQLLGMIVIGKIFSAAMSRASIRPDARRPLRLYIDEFQKFATDSVAYLLSESRKFGIHLALANQNMAQLSVTGGKQNLLEAVLGNVGSLMIFRLGAADAEKMETYVKPHLRAQDMQELPDYHVAARILNSNTPSRPFVFKTLPLKETANTLNTISSSDIISYSRRNYATPVSRVEHEIILRHEAYKKSVKEMPDGI